VDETVIGQQLVVTVNYEVRAMPDGANYQLAVNINGNTVTRTVDYGAGNDGFYVASFFGWYAGAIGQNAIQVQLDSQARILEIDESNNSHTFQGLETARMVCPGHAARSAGVDP
jgi:hypothetical protein